MRVRLDINVVLDVILVRQPWFAEAARVWDAHRDGQINAAIAGFSLPIVFFIVRRHTDHKHAHEAVQICLATLEIIPVSRPTLELAATLPGNDYEDNLQLACAMEAKLDGIVTRDRSGFPGATISILAPSDLLARLTPLSPPRNKKRK